MSFSLRYEEALKKIHEIFKIKNTQYSLIKQKLGFLKNNHMRARRVQQTLKVIVYDFYSRLHKKIIITHSETKIMHNYLNVSQSSIIVVV